jgi:hypothetical protein
VRLNPSLLFWSDVLLVTANAGLYLWWARRVRWWWCLVAAIGFVLSAASIGKLWSVWGVCLLPHAIEVEFREGMTLCPGQSVRFDLIVPGPGRDL